MGVEFDTKGLRLGLVDAGDHKIGTLADQLLLWCYHYDPLTGKYGFAVINLLRLTGLLTVGFIIGFIFIMIRREKGNTQYSPA